VVPCVFSTSLHGPGGFPEISRPCAFAVCLPRDNFFPGRSLTLFTPALASFIRPVVFTTHRRASTAAFSATTWSLAWTAVTGPVINKSTAIGIIFRISLPSKMPDGITTLLLVTNSPGPAGHTALWRSLICFCRPCCYFIHRQPI